MDQTITAIYENGVLRPLTPLRAYDAVHLAAALIVNEALVAAGLPATTLLSADNRLLNAAQAEGLATDNPNVHP